MGNSPREGNWQAEAEPIMANQSDHASRRQCRLGYFSGGVDRPYGKKTSVRETSERSAVLRANLSPGNLRGGIFPLRRNGGQGRGNRWASMLLQQSRLCFRPAGVDLPSGAETDHGEPARPRAALAVSPWFFCRRSRPPIRKTAELPNAAPLWASVLRSVLGGVFSFRQNED